MMAKTLTIVVVLGLVTASGSAFGAKAKGGARAGSTQSSQKQGIPAAGSEVGADRA